MWRIFPYKEYSGLENMAIDRVLFQGQQEGFSPPTIRFFGWNSPCISLGYFQKAKKELNLKTIQQNQVELVQRPTGGRAVFHVEELTYSVVASSNLHLWTSSQRTTYQAISQALLCGFKSLNLWSQLSRSQVDYSRQVEIKSPCFITPARLEILYEGKKLVGSAQKRNPFVFLQHGSILCSLKHQELPQYLNLLQEEQKQYLQILRQNSICLEEIFPKVLPEKIYSQIYKSFVEGLGVRDYEIGKLNDKESELVQQQIEQTISLV